MKDTAEDRILTLKGAIMMSLEHWKYLEECGGTDPFWADGVNMNLVRNHIESYKKKIEEACSQEGLPLPEIYYTKTPPEVPQDYMARADEIRLGARKSLDLYENDPNFKKLKKALDVTNEVKAQTVKNVLNYIQVLKKAIEEDDLVTMRRHCHPEGYLESAKNTADRLSEEDFLGQTTLWG